MNTQSRYTSKHLKSVFGEQYQWPPHARFCGSALEGPLSQTEYYTQRRLEGCTRAERKSFAKRRTVGEDRSLECGLVTRVKRDDPGPTDEVLSER